MTSRSKRPPTHNLKLYDDFLRSNYPQEFWVVFQSESYLRLTLSTPVYVANGNVSYSFTFLGRILSSPTSLSLKNSIPENSLFLFVMAFVQCPCGIMCLPCCHYTSAMKHCIARILARLISPNDPLRSRHSYGTTDVCLLWISPRKDTIHQSLT